MKNSLFLYLISIYLLNIEAKFPSDFSWGVSTSAYQIEGSWASGGREASIWDTYAHQNGTIANNSNGDVACDSYRLYKDDIKIMQDLGVTHYRMSISWSRLVNSKGDILSAGKDFYNNLINELLAAKIKPFVTLFHYDLPQHLLEDILTPKFQYEFENYAKICFELFGDRVDRWITFNEPMTFAVNGFGDGIQAPGRCTGNSGDTAREPYIVAHYILLAHARAVQIYRSQYHHQQGKISIVLDGDWSEPYSQDINDKMAAERRLLFQFGWFADPIYYGNYPAVMVNQVNDRLPKFTEEEANLVKGSSDFFALNHYTSRYAADHVFVNQPHTYYTDQGVLDSIYNSKNETIGQASGNDWLYIVPWGLQKLLVWIDGRYRQPEIYVTENGVVVPNEANLDFQTMLNDQFRINYIQQYLNAIDQALIQGVNVKGYFVWSLIDNFEWSDGYTMKFGLYYIDFSSKDKSRIPKSSATWYRSVIKSFINQNFLQQ